MKFHHCWIPSWKNLFGFWKIHYWPPPGKKSFDARAGKCLLRFSCSKQADANKVLRAASVMQEEISSDVGVCIKRLWQDKGIQVSISSQSDLHKLILMLAKEG